MALSTDQFKALARHGASARIAELEQEIANIRAAFPGLGGARRRRPAGSGTARRTRKRRGMSPAQKAEVSRRMKAYWAARRAAKKK